MKSSLFAVGNRWAGVVAAAVVTLSLSGCATYFGAEVTAYHQPGQSLKGQSFRFVPNPAQQDSLQFQTYAAMLRKELLAQGMLETGSPRNEIEVTFDYSTDGGSPMRYTQPQYGYVYRGSRLVRRDRVDADGRAVTVWDSVPMYGYELIGYDTYLRTVYRHEIKLTMAYVQPRKGGLSRLYEGTASTHSEDISLNNAVPLLIEALFQDFPGPNGATRHVRVLQKPGAFDRAKAGERPKQEEPTAEDAPGVGKAPDVRDGGP
ncbi:MAG: DUF4136 domain-containing protein [Lautropia sp.]|nr:DUF4136 domain-containing protein [Lautropia sp.]